MRLRLSLSEKLGMGLVVFAALPFTLALVTGVVVYNDAQSRLAHLVNVMMPGQRAILDIRASALRASLVARDAALYAEQGDAAKFNASHELLSEYSNRLEVALVRYKSEYAINSAHHIDVTADLAAAEKEKIASLDKIINAFFSQAQDARGMSDPALLSGLVTQSEELSAILEKHSALESAKLYEQARFYYFVLLGLWLTAIAGSIGVVIYLYRRLVHPLGTLAAVARNIAEGQARVIPDWRHKDEVGELFGAVRYLSDSLKRGMTALERDIAARKKVEETLADENAKKEALLASIGDGVLAVDKKGILIFMNAAAEELLGRDDFIGRPFQTLWDLEDSHGNRVPPEKIPGIITLRTGKKITTSDYWFVPRQKRKFPSAMTITPVMLRNALAGAILVFRDITGERRAEEDIKKFKEAVDAAAEHIMISDPNGVILYVNQAAEKITGYSREEMTGSRSVWWGERMSKEFYEKMLKAIKYDKKTFHGEINNRRKNGEEYTAELYISPILDNGGNVKFFVGIERDITKEKAIDRVKTEFVSLASHQLRTPLSAIKWLIEVLLESDTVTKAQREYLHDIYVSNERLINLVKDLLNVSKMEAGGIAVYAIAGLDLCKLIDDLVGSLVHRTAAKKVKIQVSCEGELKAEIDPRLLSEALRNVLDNAVTFAPPKSAVEVKGKSEDGTCIIAVHNEGPAIPEAERDKIFTKFYRGTGAQRLRPEGSGLGLFIAKSAIEAMGGKIWFESGRETGVTFFIQLPTRKK